MRSVMFALVSLLLINTQAVWAGDDSNQASDTAALGVLASEATPVLVGAAVSVTAYETGHAIVKLVDKTGSAIADLTADTIQDLADTGDSDTPRVTVVNKEIPLVVRKDYVELNEKVME